MSFDPIFFFKKWSLHFYVNKKAPICGKCCHMILEGFHLGDIKNITVERLQSTSIFVGSNISRLRRTFLWLQHRELLSTILCFESSKSFHRSCITEYDCWLYVKLPQYSLKRFVMAVEEIIVERLLCAVTFVGRNM